MIDPIVAIPAILIGLNELLKKVGMNDRWCPVVNLVGGFMAMPLLLETNNVYNSILMSLMIGLSAGGLFDLGQYTVRGK
jgi:hypothetical protein